MELNNLCITLSEEKILKNSRLNHILREDFEKSQKEEIFLKYLSLSKIGTNISDYVKIDNIESLDFVISYTTGSQRRLDQFLFNLYEKLNDYVDKLNIPKIDTCIHSFKVKEKLIKNLEGDELSKFKKELSLLLKNDKVFYNVYYNTKKENLIYRLWKNNYKYQSIVENLLNKLDDEEQIELLIKFMNPMGFKILLDKRFNILKENNSFINMLFDNYLIFKMVSNAIVNNSLKNKEKEEIYNNAFYLIKKYKKGLVWPLDNNCVEEILKGSNSLNYRMSLLRLLTQMNVKKEDLIAIKIAFFNRKAENLNIKTIEKFLAYEKYMFKYQYDRYKKELFKIDFLKNISQENLNILKDYILSNGITKISRKGKRTRKFLYYFLLDKNIKFTPCEEIQFIYQNKNIIQDDNYIEYFKDKIKNDELFREEFKKEYLSENGWMFIHEINTLNKSLLYFLFNEKVIDFSYIIGNRMFNFESIPMEYPFILDFKSLESFFLKYNIKNKKVRKEIYSKIWRDDTSFFDNGILNRIVAIKEVNPNYDEQKLFSLIDNFYILNQNYVIELVYLLNEVLKFRMDKIVNYMIKSNTFIKEANEQSNGEIFRTFRSNTWQPYANFESEMEDLCQMLHIVKMKKEDETLTVEQKEFLSEALLNLKKAKNKNLHIIHDKVSNLLTKLNQVNYKLNQEELASEYDGLKYEQLTIKVPLMNYDLIDLGENLNICVGNGYYSKKVLNKESKIIYLLKNDEINACLEFNSNNMRCIQARGLHNDYLSYYEGKNIKEIFKDFKKD